MRQEEKPCAVEEFRQVNREAGDIKINKDGQKVETEHGSPRIDNTGKEKVMYDPKQP